MVSGDAAGTGGGGGYVYRIKGNSATSGPATSDVRLEFYDKIETTVGSGAAVFVVGNLYADLKSVDATASIDYMAVGVSCAEQAANDFGWVQTWGPTAMRADGTISGGGVLTAASDAGTGSGRVDVIGGAGSGVVSLQTEPIIGYAMHDSLISRSFLVNLQISP